MRATLAVIASAAAAAALWFGLMQHDSSYRDNAIIDTPVYLGYADQVAHGKLPYRDFAVEYPPLAFAAFLPPRALASSESGYRDRFGDLMGLMLVGAAAATAAAAAAAGLGTSRTLAAGLLVAAGPALAGSVALTRFDLWPVLLAAGALAAMARRADRLAGVLIGLGAAAKLWPALLLPAAVALAWRRGGPRRAVEAALAAAAACALPFAVALVLSPGGLWHALTVQASRPLQVESLGAAVVLALSHLGIGGPYHVVTSSGSQNLSGSLAPLAARLSGGLVLAALAWTLWLGVQGVLRARDDATARSQAVRYGLAAVVASIALGHVLSPQFVLWLLPFPLLIRGWRGWAAGTVTVGILALTQLEFPRLYWDYALHQDGGATAVVLARDVALLALLAVLVGRPAAFAGSAAHDSRA